MHVIDGMLTFVATDGHRLGRYQLACPSGAGAMPEKGVIIPSKTALELLRLVKRKECPEDTLITVTDTGISFKVGEDETLSSKIIDGTFPDYVRVIPSDNPDHVAIPTAKMIDAIKQASSIYTGKDCPVSLSFTSGKVVFSVKDPEFGTASVEVITPHDVTLEIGFNGPYLMELASNIEGGTFLELASSGDPVIIRDGADDALTYVLMPIRL